ncbi:hypothetical protein EYF80_011318 [Liparis tanakae]|uniref:Uncharacterized protein n=1 Tax=Liparis tanakae TaxID=230148 RepID=A0A4Z2ILK2_9TELE|nr:hypothetical protein EYF80_011318 [Liparis tanakae]
MADAATQLCQYCVVARSSPAAPLPSALFWLSILWVIPATGGSTGLAKGPNHLLRGSHDLSDVPSSLFPFPRLLDEGEPEADVLHRQDEERSVCVAEGEGLGEQPMGNSHRVQRADAGTAASAAAAGGPDG